MSLVSVLMNLCVWLFIAVIVSFTLLIMSAIYLIIKDKKFENQQLSNN